MTSFHTVPLYGGAIAVELPSNFIDVSAIRQVPDTQEVYLSSDELTSVIIDLTERVDASIAATDEDALQYHFKDIVSDSGDTTKIWGAEKAQMSKLPETPAYTLVATQHPPSDANGAPRDARGKPQPDFTAILMLLMRLETQKTDVVVTINVPHVPGEYQPEDVDIAAQKLGPLLEEAARIRQKVMESFQIIDLGLFVQE